jgi:phosphatidylinositol alpha-1,6-mannosyltransferase
VILSVGRLVRRKGFDKLIEAMPIVLKKCENAHLAIVGEGPLRDELEAAIRRHDLAGRASLLGAAADAELPALYAAAELFALPNRDMPDGDTEGFGLVFLEANACAKPVIAGRAGGAVDAVKDGVNGLLVDGESPEDIARAILRLLDDDALRSRLSAGGLAAARQADWRSRAAQFLMLCDRLAARGTGA